MVWPILGRVVLTTAGCAVSIFISFQRDMKLARLRLNGSALFESELGSVK